MSTYRNLKSQIEKLEKQAADLLKSEVAVVVAKVRALIEEYALTASDLGFAGKAMKAERKRRTGVVKVVGAPLYADATSGKTWTGKGKPPSWIVDGLKKGKSKAEFLIVKGSTPTAAAPSAVAPINAAKVVVAQKTKRASVPTSKKKGTTKPAAKKAVVKAVAKKVAAKKVVAAKNETPKA